MGRYCEVCRGERVITLPLFKRTSPLTFDPSQPMEPLKRDYPCPECGKWADTSRVLMLKAHVTMLIRPQEDSPSYRDYMRETIARHLGEHFLRHNAIHFEEQPSVTVRGATDIIGTIGVIGREPTKAIVERLRAHGQRIIVELGKMIRAELPMHLHRRLRDMMPSAVADAVVGATEVVNECERYTMRIQEHYLESDTN